MCKYTSLHRTADLTIADCWGGQRKYPELVNEKGASLVLINSDKGRVFFNKASKSLEIRDIDFQDVMQPRLREPETKSCTYDKFWIDYQTLSFDAFMKKYGHNNYSKKKELLRKMGHLMKLPIRAINKQRGVF